MAQHAQLQNCTYFSVTIFSRKNDILQRYSPTTWLPASSRHYHCHLLNNAPSTSKPRKAACPQACQQPAARHRSCSRKQCRHKRQCGPEAQKNCVKLCKNGNQSRLHHERRISHLTLWPMVRMASAMLIINWRSLGSGVASTRNSARLSPICEYRAWLFCNVLAASL